MMHCLTIPMKLLNKVLAPLTMAMVLVMPYSHGNGGGNMLYNKMLHVLLLFSPSLSIPIIIQNRERASTRWKTNNHFLTWENEVHTT